MNKRDKTYGKHILAAAVAAFFCMGLLSNCANIGTITGGPRDSLPPVVVRMKPRAETTNFDDKVIFVEFDEYVVLKDMQKEFYTSPAMNKKPTATIRKKGIRIEIQDTLRENTTYSFNFGNAVADNNEGNMLKGFRYVFSTGDHIDSLVMSGYTADAFKGDSVSKTFIYFFDAALDSVPDYDSVIFNHKPEAIGRAYGNGIFIAENLKPKDYRIYAVEDNNGNQMYDAGVDKIGFLDSVYNPAGMPGFNAWFDTVRMHLNAEPQLYFRMFTDERPARQTLNQYNRPLQHKIMMSFAAPYPEIESFTFRNIDRSDVITEYLKPTRDSMALWINMPAEQIPDTIKAEITYMRHDSLNVLVPHTQELAFGWKKFESRQVEKERAKREKQAAKAAKQGKEAPKEENPFKYKMLGIPVNPEYDIMFEFDYPLASIDSTAISLTQGDDEESLRTVAVWMEQDTMNVRKWRLRAQWNQGQKYKLLIPPGAMVDIAGHVNDSIARDFETMDPDKFATVRVDVVGKTPDSEYIIQLQNEGGKLIEEIPHAKTGKYEFRYVEPGKVRIAVIEDGNRNGQWDVGNLVERRQPERVEQYVHTAKDPAITTKAGWIEDIELNMSELFAPVTIDMVRKRLQQEEALFLEKAREERDKQQKQRKKEPKSNQNNPMNDFMRGSGMNLPIR